MAGLGSNYLTDLRREVRNAPPRSRKSTFVFGSNSNSHGALSCRGGGGLAGGVWPVVWRGLARNLAAAADCASAWYPLGEIACRLQLIASRCTCGVANQHGPRCSTPPKWSKVEPGAWLARPKTTIITFPQPGGSWRGKAHNTMYYH